MDFLEYSLLFHKAQVNRVAFKQVNDCDAELKHMVELAVSEAATLDTALLRECLEALESIHKTGDTQLFDLCVAPNLLPQLNNRLGVPSVSKID